MYTVIFYVGLCSMERGLATPMLTGHDFQVQICVRGSEQMWQKKLCICSGASHSSNVDNLN